MNDLYVLEEDEKEFSYEKDSDVGPEHWGRIHKEWETCGKGQLQSPIDLSDKRVQVLDNLGDIRHNYKPSNAIMKNRGHDIMVFFFFFFFLFSILFILYLYIYIYFTLCDSQYFFSFANGHFGLLTWSSCI